MPILYAVRSRFTDPAREDEWNEWYAGHLDVLLGVPGFLAAQRFHSSDTSDDRPYLALYQVESADVFRSEPYQAIWGFDDWRPFIDNWTRDTFELRRGPDLDFGTPTDRRLQAAFVTGGVELADRPGLRQASIVGLDRSCNALAWRGVPSSGAEPLSAPPGAGLAQAIYTPLTECLTPPSAQEVGRQ